MNNTQVFSSGFSSELYYTYVTRFVKRGLIHASDFATSMSYNFVCD